MRKWLKQYDWGLTLSIAVAPFVLGVLTVIAHWLMPVIKAVFWVLV